MEKSPKSNKRAELFIRKSRVSSFFSIQYFSTFPVGIMQSADRNSSRISTGILVGKAAGFTYCIIQLVLKMLQYLPLEHLQLLLDWAILTENPKIGAEPLYHSSYSEIWLLEKRRKFVLFLTEIPFCQQTLRRNSAFKSANIN